MPTYEYLCGDCETKFDAWQGINDDPLTECRECGSSNVRRLISAGGGILFKGPGFYATDYRSGPAPGATKGKKTDASTDSGKSSDSTGGSSDSGGKSGSGGNGTDD